MNKLKISVLTAVMVFCFGLRAFALELDNLRSYFFNGNYKQCISEGERILSRASSGEELDELYYLLGLSYLKEGNYLRASDIFEIILNEYRHSRFRDEARLGMGDSCFMRGDFSKAEAVYQELLKDRPGTKLKPGIYYRLSQLGKKTYDRPKEDFYAQKLKTEFPRSPEALSDKEFLPGSRSVYAPAVSSESSVKIKPAVPKPELPVLAVAAVPAAPAVADPGQIISGAYSIQVGAFSSQENARKLTLKLKSQGYSAYISPAKSPNRTIYKVRVGGFSDIREAKAEEIKLKIRGYPTKIIP